MSEREAHALNELIAAQVEARFDEIDHAGNMGREDEVLSDIVQQVVVDRTGRRLSATDESWGALIVVAIAALQNAYERRAHGGT